LPNAVQKQKGTSQSNALVQGQLFGARKRGECTRAGFRKKKKRDGRRGTRCRETIEPRPAACDWNPELTWGFWGGWGRPFCRKCWRDGGARGEILMQIDSEIRGHATSGKENHGKTSKRRVFLHVEFVVCFGALFSHQGYTTGCRICAKWCTTGNSFTSPKMQFAILFSRRTTFRLDTVVRSIYLFDGDGKRRRVFSLHK
jgi:hypothetical protein